MYKMNEVPHGWVKASKVIFTRWRKTRALLSNCWYGSSWRCERRKFCYVENPNAGWKSPSTWTKPDRISCEVAVLCG